jgi:hypothetical protein
MEFPMSNSTEHKNDDEPQDGFFSNNDWNDDQDDDLGVMVSCLAGAVIISVPLVILLAACRRKCK